MLTGIHQKLILDTKLMYDNELKLILKWVDEQCVPLVREITFNNAEEITEEGLPLMILFHKREATKDVDTFTQAAQRWLFSQKGKINIVTAQAEQVYYFFLAFLL